MERKVPILWHESKYESEKSQDIYSMEKDSVFS